MSMKNYKNFKFPERNNLFYEIMLESIIIYKDKFKDLLKEMDTPMSKEILALDGKDITTRNNYFGLSNKNNDSISFVADRKYQEIIKSEIYILPEAKRIATTKIDKYPQAKAIWDDLGLEIPKEIKLHNGIRGSISQKRAISARTKKVYAIFYPLDKQYTPVPANMRYLRKENENDELLKNTQEIKAGRGMKTLLMAAGIIKNDKEVEEFVNKFKSTYDTMHDAFRYFDIVEGEEIRKYYNEKNYVSSSRGQLGNSCMKAASSSSFFDIYCLNPEKVKLVILKEKNSDKIKGRALLWKLDDGEMFLDRIYTNDDSDINLFYEFSKFNNWKNKKDVQNGVSVTLNPLNYEKFPYMDTLRCYYNYIYVLSDSFEIHPKEYCFQIQCTNGGYSTVRACPICNGEKIDPCKSCNGRGVVSTCKGCGGFGAKLCDVCKIRETVSSAFDKNEIKVGMFVRTNGSGRHASDTILVGAICAIGDDSFWLAENSYSGDDPPPGTDLLGYKYTWSISKMNHDAWIEFQEDGKSCANCDHGKIICKDCDGKGSYTCKVCNGTKGVPCPKCTKKS